MDMENLEKSHSANERLSEEAIESIRKARGQEDEGEIRELI
jgi:hypothetical protein